MGKWDRYAVTESETPPRSKWAAYATTPSVSTQTAPIYRSFFDSPAARLLFPTAGGTLGTIAGTTLGAAAGGIGAVPGAMVGGGTGAGAGESLRQTLASLTGGGPTSYPEAYQDVLAQSAFGSLQMPVARGAGAIAKTARRTASTTMDFLRGSPKHTQQVERATHDLILSLRQGGKQMTPFFDRLGQLADEAWEPMQRVANSIESPTTWEELASRVYETFGNDLQRASEIVGLLKSSVGKQTVFSAPELVTLSNRLGQRIPQNILRGRGTPRQLHQFLFDSRSVIADVLEDKAPDQLKGAIAQAKQQWASYKADWTRLRNLFHPGAAPEEDTQSGIQFIQRVASGKATQSEKDFLTRLQVKFPNLATLFQERISTTHQTQQRSRLGKAAGIGAALYMASKTPPGQSILRLVRGALPE